MIDSVGGPDKVNNLLSTLNMKTISNKNLKCMERRSGKYVESFADKCSKQAAKEAFTMEMNDIAEQESNHAAIMMGDMLDKDLGVSIHPDASPSLREKLIQPIETDKIEVNSLNTPQNLPKISDAPCHPANEIIKKPKTCVKLSSRFPCTTRKGMTCAVDTAWQKRGFDSLSSHTFFMSKSVYGKKVLKTIVSHRTCGTCKWWKKNRPFQKVRKHRCVFNHTGSARSMESVSGVRGVQELIHEGTPIDYLEGDGDNTLITRLKNDLNLSVKKRFDRNHVVKNIGKSCIVFMQATKN